MDINSFDVDLIVNRMQMAVDIVLSSEHETSKVAACLFHPSGDAEKVISRTNFRPEPFVKRFAWKDRIGRSSQFVHAETACVLEYGASAKDHYICITDPFCPNCAKTIIESGVKVVFIDHKGMDKDFVKRRAGAFNLISLKMAAAAGVNVFILNRKDRTIKVLKASPITHEITPKGIYTFALPSEINAETSLEATQSFLVSYAKTQFVNDSAESIVLCVVKNRADKLHLLATHEALTAGLYEEEIKNVEPEDTSKYRFNIDAMNKLFFALKREGLEILHNVVYCNRVPSSRSFVNMLLSPVESIVIYSDLPDHDFSGLDVAKMYGQEGLINVKWV